MVVVILDFGLFCLYSRRVILVVSSLCWSQIEIQSLLCEDTWMINVALLHSAIGFLAYNTFKNTKQCFLVLMPGCVFLF